MWHPWWYWWFVGVNWIPFKQHKEKDKAAGRLLHAQPLILAAPFQIEKRWSSSPSKHTEVRQKSKAHISGSHAGNSSACSSPADTALKSLVLEESASTSCSAHHQHPLHSPASEQNWIQKQEHRYTIICDLSFSSACTFMLSKTPVSGESASKHLNPFLCRIDHTGDCAMKFPDQCSRTWFHTSDTLRKPRAVQQRVCPYTHWNSTDHLKKLNLVCSQNKDKKDQSRK